MAEARKWYVDNDRWGNRWLYTMTWAVRTDVATRLPKLNLAGPGVYQRGEKIADLASGIGTGGRVQKAIRLASKGRVSSTLTPREELVAYNRFAGKYDDVFERTADGLYVVIDPELERESFGRLPSDIVLVQHRSTRPHSSLQPNERAICAYRRGQLVGMLMPIAHAAAPTVRVQEERRAA